LDVRTAGQELGARYVMEGSLRQAGTKLRIAVQLVDAVSGAHLWAETYERDFSPEAVFKLQDELVPRIVSTVADWYGVLPHSMSEALRHKRLEELSPYEALLRSFGYHERRTPEEHARARADLERAVQQAPDYADGWALLSIIHSEEYANGFNVQPDSLGRAIQAARRAADAAPSNALAHIALAQARFFRKEFQAFRAAAERAIALNPMDGGTVALMGRMTAYAGEWEQGCAMIERAAQLNPRHPGWYWFPLFYNAYRKGDYRGALSFALKINLPHFFYAHVVTAAAYGQLGDREAAGEALRELLALKPHFAATGRDDLARWYPAELVEHMMDGLRKAGLKIPDAKVAAPRGEQVTEKSIAVLPFANMSGAPEDEYFSDGIAEEIINALAKVEGLRVAARTSAFSFKGQKTDIPEIARKLNVTTVLEGSVRKAGKRLRITAQLIDVADGCQLWSERFDRELDDIFAVQDEIASAIAKKLEVSVSGGAHGPLVKKATRNMEAYESYLKGRHAWERFGTNLYAAVEHFERAVALDPEFAPAYAGIADAYGTLGFTGAMRPREAMPKAKAAATRAVQLDSQLAEAQCALGYVALLYDWDWPAAEKAFLRSIELNPNYSHVMHHYGHLYHAFVSYRIDEGIELCRRAAEIDPLAGYSLHGWLANLYVAGRTAEAIEHLQKELTRDPSAFHLRRLLALCYTEQGRMEEARAAIEEAVRTSGRHPWAVGELGGLHARCGRTAEAEALQAELVARSRSTYIQPTIMAFIPAWLGKFEEGFAYLEQAIEERDGVIIAVTTWPNCRPFWNHPRFAEILKRLNLRAPRRELQAGNSS
jgi:TolB-like protein/Flp pilus assembly protein TadD